MSVSFGRVPRVGARAMCSDSNSRSGKAGEGPEPRFSGSRCPGRRCEFVTRRIRVCKRLLNSSTLCYFPTRHPPGGPSSPRLEITMARKWNLRIAVGVAAVAIGSLAGVAPAAFAAGPVTAVSVHRDNPVSAQGRPRPIRSSSPPAPPARWRRAPAPSPSPTAEAGAPRRPPVTTRRHGRSQRCGQRHLWLGRQRDHQHADQRRDHRSREPVIDHHHRDHHAGRRHLRGHGRHLLGHHPGADQLHHRHRHPGGGHRR